MFFEKWGFKSSRFNEYLALAGDSADNFSIYNGIGDVAAKEILTLTDHISQIYDKDVWERIPKKYQKKLANYDKDGKLISFRKDDLKLALQLATLDFHCNCIEMPKCNNSKFITKSMLEELELYNALKKMHLLFNEE